MQAAALLFLSLTAASAFCTESPAARPATSQPLVGCTLNIELNRIHWLDDETLFGTSEPVRWRNDITGEQIATFSNEGGYIHGSIPDDWVEPLRRGKVSQKDGSQKGWRVLRAACLTCSGGSRWGSCIDNSVDTQPLRLVSEAAP